MHHHLQHHPVYRSVAHKCGALDFEQALATTEFPLALWRDMAECGLHEFDPATTSAPSTAPANTGLDSAPAGFWHTLAVAGSALTHLSRSAGLTTGWLGQQLALHFLAQHARTEVTAACTAAVRSGRSLCAIAISEPGVGAHPKHLSTTATAQGKGFLINGRKTFITHGPYADWFLVLAITRREGERKHYSTFLLPRDTPGLSLTPQSDIAGLHPLGHATMHLANCRVPPSSLIGEPGNGFAAIANPLRSLEDGLMLCPLAGALQAQIDLLLAKRTSWDAHAAGTAICLADCTAKLGIMAADILDQQGQSADLTTLIIGARALIARTQEILSEAWQDCPQAIAIGHDIQLLLSIGGKATASRVSALTR